MPTPSPGISRRAALTAGAMLMSAAAAGRLRAAPPSRPKRVIVVGGGIGGLSCAYELMKRGHEVVLFEASNRTGGHIKTMRDPLPAGHWSDLGAELFTKPGYSVYWKYVKEFGLTALHWPRRQDMYIRFGDRWYTEDHELRDASILRGMGFNAREIAYMVEHGWSELPRLYLAPYAAKITDEYQPFGVGLDHLDRITYGDLMAKDGASGAALRQFGGPRSTADGPPEGGAVSAQGRIWTDAIQRHRGMAIVSRNVYHLKGGNQLMVDAFAARLGDRIRRDCPVSAIEYGEQAAQVEYTSRGKTERLQADHLVLAISPPLLGGITIKTPWPAAKALALGNIRMDTYSRVVMVAKTPFWEGDDIPSINLLTRDSRLPFVCETSEDLPGNPRILMGETRPTQTPEATEAAFALLYPGKRRPEILQTYVYQWWKEHPTCAGCQRAPFQLGQLTQMWPHLIAPVGRVHFVGSAYDNWVGGQDAATRSANRVAGMIDSA